MIYLEFFGKNIILGAAKLCLFLAGLLMRAGGWLMKISDF